MDKLILKENELLDIISKAIHTVLKEHSMLLYSNKNKKLNEDYSRHRYYDYIEEYNPYKIFEMVMNGENLWTPLINPSMYQKALDEFVKFGYLSHFPKKYIFQWFGIIMKNTAILRATTEIAGHSIYSAFDEFYDYFFDDDGFDRNGLSWNEFLEENGLGEDDKYEAMTEYLDNIGFYDSMKLPDGSDAWSDYGIEPIEELISKYNDNLSAEEVLVLINKILDVMHFRGDLSSMFIEGGAKTLSRISNNEAYKPNNLNSLLKESFEKGLITEIASSNIYHFTSISNALKIAEEDTIYLQSSLAGSSDTSNSYNKLFYLSTTRTKFQSFGYSRKFSDNSVRIELDGDKINQVMKAKPYNYWGSSMGKLNYVQHDDKGLTRDKQEHVRDEAEDRLYSKNSSIPNAHEYIKRIDVILTNPNEENYTNYINTKNLLYSKFSKRIFVYNNLKDFNSQSENTINKLLNDDYESFGKANYVMPKDIYLSKDQINIVLAAILSGESNNIKQDSAKLLKDYGLEKYIKQGLLKTNNEYLDYPYNNFSQLADKLSYSLSELSKKPSQDKSKLMQMISDYFQKNKLKTYKDYINYKELNTAQSQNYGIVTELVRKGVIDDKKEINALLIRNVDTYDYVIVTNPYEIKINLINNDIEDVAYNFINYTEDNMKSNSYESYEKYIKRIFSKNPTIGEVMDMLKKLGYQNNLTEMLSNILNTRIKEETINCYSLYGDMVMPNCINNKNYNLSYYLKLFKK